MRRKDHFFVFFGDLMHFVRKFEILLINVFDYFSMKDWENWLLSYFDYFNWLKRIFACFGIIGQFLEFSESFFVNIMSNF